MKTLIQWSTKKPQDWDEIDSKDWVNLPFKPEPKGGEAIDNKKGWICHLNVQGVRFSGDHYAIKGIRGSKGIMVYCWNDDPEDFPAGEKYATVWKIMPLAPDRKFGGAINTRQSRTIYAQSKKYKCFESLMPIENTVLKKWSEFKPPKESLIRHGVWMSDKKYKEHKKKQSLRGWRYFGDHLHPRELDKNGLVKSQRLQGRWKKAKGTITYYLLNTNLPSGIHAATFEKSMETTISGLTTPLSSPVGAGGDVFTHLFTTQANNPNSEDWPNGTYRCQMDVSVAGADITYGLMTLGASAGHFARVDAGLTGDQETWTQSEGAFTGTGTRTATSSRNPVAGAAGDRFECLVAAANANVMEAQNLAINVESSDSFADGPWPTPSTGQKAYNYGFTIISSILGLILKPKKTIMDRR